MDAKPHAPVANELVAADCLTLITPELEAIPEDQLVPFNLDAMRVVRTVLGCLPKLAPLRDELSTLPRFDLERFDKLETYAVALFAAHAQAQSALKPPDQLQAMLERGAILRRDLRQFALALGHAQLMDVRALANLRSQRGTAALSESLGALAFMFRKALPRIKGKTPLTQADLLEAERLSLAIARAAGRRRYARADIMKAQQLRQRAFTRLLWTWEHTRRAVAYLCDRTRDPDEIAPTLYGTRKRRKKVEFIPVAASTVEGAPTALPNELAPARIQPLNVNPFLSGDN